MIWYRSMTKNRESRRTPKLSHLIYDKDNAVLWVKYGFLINGAESIWCPFEKQNNIVPVLIFRAVMTTYYKLGNLKGQMYFLLNSGVQKSETEVLFPSRGSKGWTVLCPSPSFWSLPAIRGVAWLADTSLKSLLLSSHGFLLWVSILSILSLS